MTLFQRKLRTLDGLSSLHTDMKIETKRFRRRRRRGWRKQIPELASEEEETCQKETSGGDCHPWFTFPPPLQWAVLRSAKGSDAGGCDV